MFSSGLGGFSGCRYGSPVVTTVSCVFFLALLSGCATVEKPQPPPTPPKIARPKPAAVAIMVSDDAPVFADIAKEIAGRLKGRATIYNLKGDPSKRAAIIQTIQRSRQGQVVAVGLFAAQAARTLSGKQVVFCQVFNYKDHDLVTTWMKGVSMLPSADKQFRAWKALDPGLTKVGVITGRNLRDVVGNERVAAERVGIKLTHREVESDKELSHAYRELASKIQGLLLLPDNRVLSRRVLREVMSYSVKQGKQVVVFNPQFLELGALMSVTGKRSDVVSQVLMRLRQAQGQQSVPGVAVTPLMQIELQVNTHAAKRLGLNVPKQVKGFVNAP